MADKINVTSKKLYRSLRNNGMSKKKAGRVLADISGSAGTAKKRKLRVHPVAKIKGGVRNLRTH